MAPAQPGGDPPASGPAPTRPTPPTATFPESGQAPQDAAPATEAPAKEAPEDTAAPPTAEQPAEAAPPAAGTAEAARGAPITPQLLALCASGEVAVRDYCLAQLELAPELPPTAQEVVGKLAATDTNLSARARALYLEVYGVEPPPLAAPPTEPEEPRPSATEEAALPPGDPMRVVYAPTAFTRPVGAVGFNAFELGTMTLDFGVTEHLELGVQSAIPIGFLTVGGLVKVGLPFEGGAVAVRGNVLALKLLEAEEPAAIVYGAGPVLTIGNYDDYFNIGAQFYGLTVEDETATLALPNVGGSVRLSKATRMSAELYLPTALQQRDEPRLGELALLLWGIRLFGDHVWGDIALIEPICEGCSDIYRVIPLGIPFLNIGGSW